VCGPRKKERKKEKKTTERLKSFPALEGEGTTGYSGVHRDQENKIAEVEALRVVVSKEELDFATVN
jgi:hypothetical protein